MLDCFFELIRVAIGQQEALSHVPSAEEWVEIYSAAKKQAVVGVAFCGIKLLPPEQTVCLPLPMKLEWLAVTAQIQSRNELLNRRCLELQELVERNSMKCCILKGQGVAELYSAPLNLYRQSGDIDVWLDAPKDRVIDFVMGIAPTGDFDQKHIHFQVFDDVDVEAHWIPVHRESPKFNRVLEAYFSKEKEQQHSYLAGTLHTPTVDFQLVHQLLHVYGHYVYEGVGLRQLMDLYFTQRAFVQCMPEKREEVLSIFKRLGLMKFVAGTQYVLLRVFVLDNDALLCVPDKKEGQLLWDEMVNGGNFGQYDRRNLVKNESYLHRAWRRWSRRWRMVRFDALGTILMPYSRIRLEVWMRTVRRKYRV